ncbi:flap endonuclease-1 [Candidatus Bathyarchaeota archaeon]|nr:flap endonuclease-1 [Candidatus Bathyarchaeota archaeon]
MGVDLKDIVSRREISLDQLSNKIIAIDAYNTLYQFLSIIRQPDGTPLMDKQGRVTSHLSGLFYRNANLMEKEIKLVYVFDGEPPSLKEMEIKRRTKVKEEALIKYEDALKRGAIEEARRYAQVTAQLKDYMVEDATHLLDLMGIPWIQAPSEGEAQAAHMAAKGDVWAAASQDYDSLLFGAPRLVRNITISGRRKLPRKNVYIEVVPEVVELNQVLSELNITRELLVDIGILIGTDYNPGIKGIGPKTALKLVKEHGSLEKILPKIGEACDDIKIDQIRSIFLKPTVTDVYQLKWKPPDITGIIDFLCRERDFSEERVRVALEKATAGIKEAKGKVTLEGWLN